MATTIVTLPDDLHESLKRLAADEHRTVNDTIVVAVAEYIRSRDKKAAVQALAAEVAEKHRELLLDRLGR